MKLTFEVLKDTYSIYKLKADAVIPVGIDDGVFCSVSRTTDELSIVCRQNLISTFSEVNNDWRVLKVSGPLDFSLIGIIAEISGILNECKISIFTISTFDTDYIMVKENNLLKAVNALTTGGHQVFYK